MYCLPVFLILLLLISSAPSAPPQPRNKDRVHLVSLLDNQKQILQRDWNGCCAKKAGCCSWGK
uniref:Conotoxin n=1 Tax=Conus magus TaxID=6492 RepID=A0A5P8I0P8_CONMA|nr:conotoxin superfamily T [Conus magus]